MSESELIKSNKEFIKEMNEKDPDFFDHLKKGQQPEYFVIACSDSRVSPALISNMEPGRIFEHRNIANQVLEGDDSLSASLYFALKHLQVKHIVIKGHTECGGVHAAWTGNDEEGMRSWVSGICDNLPDADEGNGMSFEELSEYNVKKQVENVKNHPIYREYGEGVTVNGYIFRLATGELDGIV